MKTYIELMDIYNVSDVPIIKLLLESEKIEYELLGEYTLQTSQNLTMGMSGAKLKIEVQKMDQAIAILEKNGFYSHSPSQQDESLFADKKYMLIVSTILLSIILLITVLVYNIR